MIFHRDLTAELLSQWQPSATLNFQNFNAELENFVNSDKQHTHFELTY